MRPAIRVAIGIGLPVVFWFGFFATTRLVPDEPTARAPVNFVHYDIYQLYYPSLDRYFDELAHGRVPLWDPDRAVGYPAMGSHLFGIFYPLNAAFLFTSVGVGLSITCLLHFLLAIWGTTRLARGMRIGRFGAAVAGVGYAFSGFLVMSLWHPSLFNAVATAPLVAAIGDRWARKGGLGRAATFGVAVGVQFLAGYAQGTFFLLYALTPWLAFRAIRRAGVAGTLRGRVPQAIVAGALAVATSAVVVLPARDVAARSIRPPARLALDQVHPAGPLTPNAWAASVLDPRRGIPGPDASAEAPAHYYFRGFPYVGLVVLLLALAAPSLSRRRVLAFALLGTAAIAIGLAFGSAGKLFPTAHALVPTLDWFRFPRRFLAIAAIAIALACGLAADGLRRRSTRRVAGLGSLAAVALALSALAASVQAPPGLWPIVAGVGAATVALAAAVRAERRAVATAGAIALVTAIAADAFHRHTNWVLHPSADPAPFSELEEERAFLRENAGLDRVYLQRYGGKVRTYLPAKAGLIDGYATCHDYEALTLVRYERFLATIRDGSPDTALGFAGNQPLFLTAHMYANSRLMDWMGVRYFVVEKGNWRETEVASLPAKDGDGTLLRRVFTGPIASVFENPHRLPRARFVDRVRVVPNESGVIPAMLDPTLAPHTTAVLESPLPLPEPTGAASSATCRIVDYAPSRVVIDVECGAPGVVVLTDQFDPGWRATLDGEHASIVRADYLFRGVRIPEAGRHRIEMTYAPTSFRLGAWLGAFGLVGWVVALAIGRRRR